MRLAMMAAILSALLSTEGFAAEAASHVGAEATRPASFSPQTADAGPAAVNSDHDPARKPLIKGDLRTFDISGFRLGMSPVEVRQVAAEAHLMASDGSRRVPFGPDRLGTRSADLNLNVARAAAVRLGRPRPNGPTVVSEVLLYGQEGNRYYVDFLPMESGPQLSTVMLVASSKGSTPKSFPDAVVEKYGKPPTAEIGADRLFAHWCTREPVSCEDGPWIMVKTDDHEEQVKLTVGDRAVIELNRRIDGAGAAAAASAATKPKL